MDCKFQVGQRVVCVHEGRWFHWSTPSVGPKRGDICTIARITPLDSDTYLWFSDSFPGAAFQHRGFRPLVERKTDISVFQRILDRCNESKKLSDAVDKYMSV